MVALHCILWGGAACNTRPLAHTCPCSGGSSEFSFLARRVPLEVVDLILLLVFFLLISSLCSWLKVFSSWSLRGAIRQPPAKEAIRAATEKQKQKQALDSRQSNACLTYTKCGIRMV